MSVTRSSSGRRPAQRRPLGIGPTLAVALLAVLAVAVLVWLGPGQTKPAATTTVNIPTSGRTIGYANAPVTIDEWGDFQ